MPRNATIETQGLVDRERLREALRLLREAGERGLTRQGLAHALGDVSLRSVDRALVLLEAQGARLERIREGRPSVLRFVVKKGPSWDEHVSPEARLALRLAGLSLAQSGTLLWQDKLEALEALATGRMSNRDRALFEQLARAVQVHGGVEDPVESPDVLEPILRALESGRELEVDYQSAAAREPSPHTVVPYALSHDLFSGGVFLLAWDPGRRTPIHLRLNRIVRARVTARTGVITRPELMDRAARYQIGGWTSPEEPFAVEARIRGSHWVQAFREAPPALPDFEADPARDGKTARVRFKANHENGATRWLLQFGPAAEVLAPDWLRARLRDLHLEAARQHE
jgi:predicted DNA-binding transcriptional regulator YafY